MPNDFAGTVEGSGTIPSALLGAPPLVINLTVLKKLQYDDAEHLPANLKKVVYTPARTSPKRVKESRIRYTCMRRSFKIIQDHSRISKTTYKIVQDCPNHSRSFKFTTAGVIHDHLSSLDCGRTLKILQEHPRFFKNVQDPFMTIQDHSRPFKII